MNDNYEPLNAKVELDLSEETEKAETPTPEFSEDLINWAAKLPRSQKRKAIQDGKKEYEKAKFNFIKFIEKLELSDLEAYKGSYKVLDNTTLPKAELDVIIRGTTRYNHQAKEWHNWQLDLFDKYITKKSK
jgi:hypothetical protein